MRTIPSSLAAHLAGGVTTLCRCWRLTRRDGGVFGFTDHDRDLAFGGVVHQARTGLDAAEVTTELGFSVGGGEVSGALSAAALNEGDLAAGLYDDATIETWLVDWSDPENRLLLDVGTVGEIRRADGAFVAEIRGLMHRLDGEGGRLFTAACAADLGDACCGVAAGAITAGGAVTETDGALGIVAAALGAYSDGWFTAGRLLWTGGANAGLAGEVKAHRQVGERAELDLWQRAARPILPGDSFEVTAGCDKAFSTCRAKFANVVNFRGFPHMPGNDFVVRPARQGEPGFDGGSLFR